MQFNCSGFVVTKSEQHILVQPLKLLPFLAPRSLILQKVQVFNFKILIR